MNWIYGTGKRAFGLIAVIVALLLIVAYTKQTRANFRLKGEETSSYAPLAKDQVLEKKKFVVLIASFNNEPYAVRNLRSVFEQDYDNYRVIYIDDASTDNTVNLVKEMIHTYNQETRVTLLCNQENKGPLPNQYYAIMSCQDDEIIVTLDGDDWFAHTGVLSLLNRYYNDENVWLTYGQLIEYPSYKRGSCKEPLFNHLKRGKIRDGWHYLRKHEWLFSQLRTFYAGLFKRIKLKDLLENGNFYRVAGDIVIMCPMLEMARDHAKFVPEILYVYNRETPLNDDKIWKKEQVRVARKIFDAKPYDALTTHPAFPIESESSLGVDVVVLSDNNPMRLLAFLESIELYMSKVRSIHVFYEAKNFAFARGYEIVRGYFDKPSYCQIEKMGEFEEVLSKLVSDKGCQYILLAQDEMFMKNKIDLGFVVERLERTGASSFALSLGLHVDYLPENIFPVGDGCFLWEVSGAKGDWRQTNNVNMTVYKKEDVEKFIRSMSFSTIKEFKGTWQRGLDSRSINVCFAESRAVLCPLHFILQDIGEEMPFYSNVELNERLLEGYKIDVSKPYAVRNKDITVSFYPNFIVR